MQTRESKGRRALLYKRIVLLNYLTRILERGGRIIVSLMK